MVKKLKIAFDRLWDKMLGCDLNSLTLKGVDDMELKDIPSTFLKHDTMYRGKQIQWRFPQKVLVLTMVDSKGNQFSTIRPRENTFGSKGSKLRYYTRNIGNPVQVVFPNDYDIIGELRYRTEQPKGGLDKWF